MDIRLATDHDQQRWDAFVLRSPHGSFMQLSAWAAMHRQLQVPVWQFVAEEGSTIIAVVLVIKRAVPFGRSWVYAPRGPIIAEELSQEDRLLVWQKTEQALVHLAEQQQAIFLRIDPGIGADHWLAAQVRAGRAPWQKSEREVQPQHTLRIDLSLSEEELLAGMHRKTRYNIRLAQRKGVTVEFSSAPSAVQKFIDLTHQQADRGTFRYHPDQYYQAMLEVLGPAGLAEVASARQGEDVLAASIVITAGPTATYAHGASSSARREVMAPYLLHWETIRRAKQRGCRFYDFFGVAPADAPADHPWAGITRFKSGFGGQRESYIGAYDRVLDSGLYTLFTAARRVREALRY